MPRQIRGQYSGAIYHVMSRGDRRDDIFLDDVDRQEFLAALAAVCLKTGWRVHAYCLMRNRFHLVVETPKKGQTRAMPHRSAGGSQNKYRKSSLSAQEAVRRSRLFGKVSRELAPIGDNSRETTNVFEIRLLSPKINDSDERNLRF